MDLGEASFTVNSGVARLCFSHPKANSLPSSLLNQIAELIDQCSSIESVKLIMLSSRGEKTFCAGASFDELQTIDDLEKATEYFLGFAKVILAIRRCPKWVVVRVQGKAVGGALGLIAAADYAIASAQASVRLSEYSLGFGPFVIGPAVERKIGTAFFTQAAIDTAWKDPQWCYSNGLYSSVHPSIHELDTHIEQLTTELTTRSPLATQHLKAIFWHSTDHWPQLLKERAQTSAKLYLKNSISSR